MYSCQPWARDREPARPAVVAQRGHGHLGPVGGARRAGAGAPPRARRARRRRCRPRPTTSSPTVRLIGNRPPSISGETPSMITRDGACSCVEPGFACACSAWTFASVAMIPPPPRRRSVSRGHFTEPRRPARSGPAGRALIQQRASQILARGRIVPRAILTRIDHGEGAEEEGAVDRSLSRFPAILEWAVRVRGGAMPRAGREETQDIHGEGGTPTGKPGGGEGGGGGGEGGGGGGQIAVHTPRPWAVASTPRVEVRREATHEPRARWPNRKSPAESSIAAGKVRIQARPMLRMVAIWMPDCWPTWCRRRPRRARGSC